MTMEYLFQGQNKSPFGAEVRRTTIIPPKPIGKPQEVPQIRKSEVEKHHIKRSGK